MTSIGFGAFFWCSNLETAYFMGNAPVMGMDVFGKCAESFSVRYSVTGSGFTDPWHGYKATSEIIPASAEISPLLYVWIGVAALSVGAAVTLVFVIKKKKQKNDGPDKHSS